MLRKQCLRVGLRLQVTLMHEIGIRLIYISAT